eukprot:1161645-Pelagomonas_calceolata.AAC.13
MALFGSTGRQKDSAEAPKCSAQECLSQRRLWAESFRMGNKPERGRCLPPEAGRRRYKNTAEAGGGHCSYGKNKPQTKQEALNGWSPQWIREHSMAGAVNDSKSPQ